jgi:hypothetical protein
MFPKLYKEDETKSTSLYFFNDIPVVFSAPVVCPRSETPF